MSTDSNLCFDVIMTIMIIAGSGALAWVTDFSYRGWIKQLDAGAAPDVARTAIKTLTSNSMLTLNIGMVIGVSVANIGHKWMAAAAALCVVSCVAAVWARLARPSGRSGSASRV